MPTNTETHTEARGWNIRVPLSNEEWRAVKMLALQRGQTLQQLLATVLRDMIEPTK